LDRIGQSSLPHFSSCPSQQSTTDPSHAAPCETFKMHSKILAVLGLCVAASILQAADARGSASAAPRRLLGSYKDYGHHPRKHDHDHDRKKHHRHDKDYYRRRLEDKENKAAESSSYGKYDYA
ncbi:hypothetical protein L915_12878, partial [Phytophthora nicotianae]